MRLQILGSGAAEGWPAVFCGCTACRRARELGGKNIRTRSGAQLGARHKIDFSCDSFSQALRHRLDWTKLEHLFFTHAHNDHFYPAEIKMRRAGYAHPAPGREEKRLLDIYGDALIHRGLTDVLPDLAEAGAVFHELTPMQPIQAGPVTAVPLPANHMRGSAFIYLFTQNDKTLLYALDTGWLPEETWAYLAQGPVLNCVVLDATYGPNAGCGGHLGLAEVIKAKEKMAALGLVTASSLVLANHFSHNGGLLHHELEELLNPHGIIAAYDGLILEF